MFKAVVNCNHRQIWLNGEQTAVIELTSIYDENGKEIRDHAWVNEESLKGFIPKNNSYKIDIVFEADLGEYWSIGKDYKQVKKPKFTNIRDIVFVRSYKNKTKGMKDAKVK